MAFQRKTGTDTNGNPYDYEEDDGQPENPNAPAPWSAPPTAPKPPPTDLNERARQDPTFNPRDELIRQGRGAWEAALKEAGGSMYDPSDLEGVIRQVSYAQNAGRDPGDFVREAIARYGQRASNTPGGGDSTTKGWTNSGAGGGSNSGGGGGGSSTTRDPRSDELYNILMGRAKQGLTVERNDPIIHAQSAAFAANTDRSTRNYLADQAEQAGPYANLRGEQRMATEHAGQAQGSFEAQLMGRELTARRDEIQAALSGMQGMLTSEQQMSLQRELAQMNDALQRYNIGSQNDQFSQRLGLDATDRANYWKYMNSRN